MTSSLVSCVWIPLVPPFNCRVLVVAWDLLLNSSPLHNITASANTASRYLHSTPVRVSVIFPRTVCHSLSFSVIFPKPQGTQMFPLQYYNWFIMATVWNLLKSIKDIKILTFLNHRTIWECKFTCYCPTESVKNVNINVRYWVRMLEEECKKQEYANSAALIEIVQSLGAKVSDMVVRQSVCNGVKMTTHLCSIRYDTNITFLFQTIRLNLNISLCNTAHNIFVG